jgi:uncharacterized protein YdaT
MPWTAKSFKQRHWHKATEHQAQEAAHIANAMLRSGAKEAVAIATAIAQAKGEK